MKWEKRACEKTRNSKFDQTFELIPRSPTFWTSFLTTTVSMASAFDDDDDAFLYGDEDDSQSTPNIVNGELVLSGHRIKVEQFASELSSTTSVSTFIQQ